MSELVNMVGATTWLVDRRTGEWTAHRTLEDTHSLPLIRAANEWADLPMHLVFEDEDSIRQFLADDNHELTHVRRLVQRTRETRNSIVMTVEELLRYAGINRRITRQSDDDWVYALQTTTFTEVLGQKLDLIFELRPLSWRWIETVTDDLVAYQYGLFLQYAESLVAAVFSEPQAQDSGSEVRFSLPDFFDSTMQNDRGAFTLVVPEHRGRSILWIRHGVYEPLRPADPYPAMIFRMVPPPIKKSSKKVAPVTRRLTMDVLTASSQNVPIRHSMNPAA